MKPRQFLIIILSITLLVTSYLCTSNRPEPASKNRSLADLMVANYFPPSAGLTPENGATLCETLKSLEERPLFERAGKGEAYRFIWQHSKCPPVCVTLYCNQGNPGSAALTKSQIDKDYDPKKRLYTGGITHEEIAVDASETAELIKNFDAAKFWQIDRFDEYTRPPLYDFELFGRRISSSNDASLKDGVLWIMEGYKNGQYRIVQRQSPDEGDAITKLGRMLLNQAKIYRRGEREIY
ncbi:MAG: hypothetical protein QG574_4976 [Cyanobacteriota bacterium erpe_2018_sw_21hr_WHONDRS-SW48-000092_B_bin.40]|nr:hypothetical protein [Cyanobacteriota bacterium erpe_2018_sw_21hr_WHONDRS-SW48-000092_B_bin.40]